MWLDSGSSGHSGDSDLQGESHTEQVANIHQSPDVTFVTGENKLHQFDKWKDELMADLRLAPDQDNELKSVPARDKQIGQESVFCCLPWICCCCRRFLSSTKLCCLSCVLFTLHFVRRIKTKSREVGREQTSFLLLISLSPIQEARQM